MKIYNSIAEAIGKTPLFELINYKKKYRLAAKILAKAEYFNPAGSVKDRAVYSMLKDAERQGRLARGTTVIEPTSGNTGIAIAALCAAYGLRAVIVMPENFSKERIKIMEAYGARVVLTDRSGGMGGAIATAEKLQKDTPDSLILGQFSNPANPSAHYHTTAPEIWEATEGRIDIFVAGVGTGGTLTGAGAYFKEKNPDIKNYAVEPRSSPVLSGGERGVHEIQGIGAGLVPEILDKAVYDGVITVSDGDALSSAKEVARGEGLFVGISSGAALCAAKRLAERAENAGKTIVTIFPDGGDRYLSVF